MEALAETKFTPSDPAGSGSQRLSDRVNIPKDFILGAAMSAHQVEGNNTHTDWWYYEQQGRLPKSGRACDYWNRFAEDHQIASDIGLNCLRISIEWARIEPEMGKWDSSAVEHYRKILEDMHAKGLSAFVTLQHFTLPLWAAKLGGFRNKVVREHFAAYSAKVVSALNGLVACWFTINEPGVTALLSYGQGHHPPFKKNPWLVWRVQSAIAKAHLQAYGAIKKTTPSAKVGIVVNHVYYEPHSSSDSFLAHMADYFSNHYFLRQLRKHFDCLGLNYYFYHSITWNLFKGFEITNERLPKSDMGWRTYPKGIYYVLKGLMKYRVPVYVTENGIANARDDMRKDYIRQHLYWALKARDEGVPLRGYMYWSLLDNYEWHDGYGPKFGLVEVNFETQERKIRESAKIFNEILQKKYEHMGNNSSNRIFPPRY